MGSIDVLIFAKLREKVGSNYLSVTVGSESTPRDEFFDLILSQYPEFAEIVKTCALAVDNAYTSADTIITKNSEVALILPVSGG